MKIRISHILFIVALFFAADGYSQVDRTVGPGQYKQVKPKVKKADFVEDSVTFLTKAINLDGFQQAAIRDIIASKKDEADALTANKRMKLVEKREEARKIALFVYNESLPLLSKEQAEKYTKIIEQQYGGLNQE